MFSPARADSLIDILIYFGSSTIGRYRIRILNFSTQSRHYYDYYWPIMNAVCPLFWLTSWPGENKKKTCVKRKPLHIRRFLHSYGKSHCGTTANAGVILRHIEKIWLVYPISYINTVRTCLHKPGTCWDMACNSMAATLQPCQYVRSSPVSDPFMSRCVVCCVPVTCWYGTTAVVWWVAERESPSLTLTKAEQRFLQPDWS